MLRSQNSPIGYGRGWCQNACRGHKQKNMLISFLSIDPWRTVMFKGGVLYRSHCIFPKHLSFARFNSVLRPFTPKAETWSSVHMGVWDEVRGVFRSARGCPSCFLAVFVAGIFRQNSSRLVGKPGGVNFILIVVVWNLGWAHGWVVEKPGGGKFQFNCCGLKNEVGSKFKFVNFLWGGWKNKVGSI